MTGGACSARAWARASTVALWLALVVPALAWACGACVEDKVAATYDHAVVQKAAAVGDTVVFCDVAGRFDTAQLQRAAARTRGVIAHTVRVSSEPAALSFAIDASKQSPQAAALAVQQLAPRGVRLSVVRVMAAPR